MEQKIIKVGSRLSIMLPGKQVRLFEIVGDSNNAAPECGIISAFSSLGQALIGKHEGEEVRYMTKTSELRAKVISIEL